MSLLNHLNRFKGTSADDVRIMRRTGLQGALVRQRRSDLRRAGLSTFEAHDKAMSRFGFSLHLLVFAC